MRKLVLAVMILGLAFVAAGCAPAPQRAPSRPAEVAPAPAAAPTAGRELAAGDTGRPLAGDTERMIIRTANLNVVVSDTAQAQSAIIDAVNGMGGYVADASAWREGEQLRARLTVRVPAEKLDALLAAVKALSVRVQQENITGRDVTEEYTDLKAQLVNLEATERELRELLTEVRQKTGKAEDVLAIYRELTQIRGEIERVQGRMQYLNNLSALATLTVELIPDVLARPVVEPGWRPLETVKNAGRALVNTLKGLVDALIWIVIVVIPVLIILAIPVVLLVLLIRWLGKQVKRKKGS
ncbi:MAG: DUF4349 domain-containing protein [Anaerolineae bacterium]|nr:DUF4349 domain-containing protein [Anaerolineae bacterium]